MEHVGKSPFIVEHNTISMAIFNSSVQLPEVMLFSSLLELVIPSFIHQFDQAGDSMLAAWVAHRC